MLVAAMDISPGWHIKVARTCCGHELRARVGGESKDLFMVHKLADPSRLQFERFNSYDPSRETQTFDQVILLRTRGAFAERSDVSPSFTASCAGAAPCSLRSKLFAPSASGGGSRYEGIGKARANIARSYRVSDRGWNWRSSCLSGGPILACDS